MLFCFVGGSYLVHSGCSFFSVSCAELYWYCAESTKAENQPTACIYRSNCPWGGGAKIEGFTSNTFHIHLWIYPQVRFIPLLVKCVVAKIIFSTFCVLWYFAAVLLVWKFGTVPWPSFRFISIKQSGLHFEWRSYEPQASLTPRAWGLKLPATLYCVIFDLIKSSRSQSLRGEKWRGKKCNWRRVQIKRLIFGWNESFQMSQHIIEDQILFGTSYK